ncbi:MAG TPA: VOC family protein, partial [Spirochaetales bacterium]|nr:VOC family protein [Spirochaetales bacterium]
MSPSPRKARSGPGLLGFHHAAVICSDYERSKRFYVETLGLEPLAEAWRPESCSWKLDLGAGAGYIVELFWFGERPPRPDRP